jgi:hypothetical protein
MIDFISVLSLLIAYVLPLVLGLAILHCRANVGERLHWAVALGYGYPIGLVAITLLMRLMSLIQVRWHLAVISVLAIAITAALVATTRATRQAAFWRATQGNSFTADWQALPRIVKVLLCAALAWLILRYVTLSLELITRPLFAWDAWAQWATKAKIWTHHNGITPMLPLHEWRVADLSAAMPAYTDQAWFYPYTLPLIQSWQAAALGRFDDALINMPLAMLYASLLLAAYGQARLLGAGIALAVGFCFFLGTLPFANTHVALGGYADLPIAVYVSLSVLALAIVAQRRAALQPISWRHWFMIALPALVLPTIKLPGAVWLVGIVFCALSLLKPRVFAWSFVLLALTGISFLFVASMSEMRIFYYKFTPAADPAAVAASLADNMFELANWHLFWYVAIALALWRWRSFSLAKLLPVAIFSAFAIAFLAVVFFLSITSAYIADYGTVNRALIHAVPAMAVLLLLLWLNPVEKKLQL